MKVLALALATFALALPAAAAAFPEQPGPHVGHACTVIATNPDQALDLTTLQGHMSPRAVANVVPLFVDACTPAP